MPAVVANLLPPTITKKELPRNKPNTLDDKASFADKLDQVKAKKPDLTRTLPAKPAKVKKANEKKSDATNEEPTEAPTAESAKSAKKPEDKQTAENPAVESNEPLASDKVDKKDPVEKPSEGEVSDEQPAEYAALAYNPAVKPIDPDSRETSEEKQNPNQAPTAAVVEHTDLPTDRATDAAAASNAPVASKKDEKDAGKPGEREDRSSQIKLGAGLEKQIQAVANSSEDTDSQAGQGQHDQPAAAHGTPSAHSQNNPDNATAESDEIPAASVEPKHAARHAHLGTETGSAISSAGVGPQNVDLPRDASSSTDSTESSESAKISSVDATRLAAELQPQHTKTDSTSSQFKVVQTQQPAEARFVEENHPRIVTSVHGQLLPKGGSMQIRLDPPDLGAVWVSVQVRDGVMSAAFETSTEQATQLLSHSLSQLKTSLESNGMNVQRLQVEQTRPNDVQNQSNDKQQSSSEQNQSNWNEQQRRETLRRMWKKLAGGDPLDLFA